MHPIDPDAARSAARGWFGPHQELLTTAGILVLALLPRILYLLVARPGFDSQSWWLSDSLLKNGVLGFDGEKTTAFEPAYPVFLAVARVLVGQRVLLVQAVQ